VVHLLGVFLNHKLTEFICQRHRESTEREEWRRAAPAPTRPPRSR
jgi:hypothetical protein